MITVNTYNITEQAVYSGISSGVEQLLQDVASFSKPEVLTATLTNAVMQELCSVLEFGVQPVRFTPDLMYKLMQASKEQVAAPNDSNA